MGKLYIPYPAECERSIRSVGIWPLDQQGSYAEGNALWALDEVNLWRHCTRKNQDLLLSHRSWIVCELTKLVATQVLFEVVEDGTTRHFFAPGRIISPTEIRQIFDGAYFFDLSRN